MTSTVYTIHDSIYIYIQIIIAPTPPNFGLTCSSIFASHPGKVLHRATRHWELTSWIKNSG